MTNAKYARLTGGLIFAWFLFSLIASALHLFTTGPDQPPLPIGLAAVVPLVIFGVWAATAQPFRRFLLSLSPRALTFVHTWRTEGLVFLVLYTYGILPGRFALPAGIGDIAIGLTAPLVAIKLTNPSRRGSFIAWQLLGIADLVTAVGLGVTSQMLHPHGISISAMTVLPMSLIPTFAVPLLMILHLICIAQALRWPEHARSSAGEQVPSPAI